METIAVTVAANVMRSLVEKLGDMLTDNVKLLRGLSGDVRDLEAELTSMSAFLRAAERPQDNDLQVKVWVDQVIDLTHDIEACIDRFNTLVGRLDEDARRGCFCRMACKLGKLVASHEIATEIRRIKAQVQQVRERHSRYYDPRVSPGPSASISATAPGPITSRFGTAHGLSQHDPRLAAHLVKEAELVGIDGSREKLIEWLLADKMSQLRVISVVGMGGLGKTTLVKKVFDSSRVSGGRFQCRAWITVSQSLDITGLLKDMIRQLFSNPPQETETANKTELFQILIDYLQDKRYLIVFDDIWTISDWETIKRALHTNELGSRIMVTTRIESVAYNCSAHIHEYVYKLQPLSPEQSWDLFCRRVFNKTGQGCPPHLTYLSEGIVKRCGGLPLALVAIGGLLASKPNKNEAEWQKVHDHLGLEMETNPSLEGMKQILKLSYDDLPSDLKPAFLYMSIFPEDYSIGCIRLVGRWVAKGLVSRKQSKTLEEVAEDYFFELLNRSMIQPSEINIGGKVKSARVHDIMREVIVTMSTGVTVLDERNLSMEPKHCIQHIAVHSSSQLEEIPENKSTARIQSMTMFGDARPSLISPKMERLTVLDLQGCKLVRDHHIKIMCKFRHLKYLNLRYTPVRSIPESLGELLNLQTLDVRDIRELTLPSKIQLPQLRNLLCSAYYLHRQAKEYVAACLPRRVDKSKALQTLAHVSAGCSSASDIRKLAKLTQLRKLGVVGLTEKNVVEFCATLEKLSSGLRSLAVWMDTKLEVFRFLDSIRSPPLHLRTLKLGGNVKALPRWVASLHEVTRIALQGPEIGEDAMTVLRNLPSLIELRLSSSETMKLCISADGFRRLRLLYLTLGVQLLKFEKGAMPNLEKLQVWLPWSTLQGIEHLTRLKEVVAEDIRYVDELDLEVVTVPVGAHPNCPKLIVMPGTDARI